MPYLIEFIETGENKIHQLNVGTYRVGRYLDNDILVNHRTVSRYHAEVIVNQDKTIIKDCKSTNSTYINKTEIIEAPIQEGDLVTFGLAAFRFTTINPDKSQSQSQSVDIERTKIDKSIIKNFSPTRELSSFDRNLLVTEKIANLKADQENNSHLKIIKKSIVLLELTLKLLCTKEPEKLLRMIPQITLLMFALF